MMIQHNHTAAGLHCIYSTPEDGGRDALPTMLREAADMIERDDLNVWTISVDLDDVGGTKVDIYYEARRGPIRSREPFRLDEEFQAAMRQAAIDRCGHPDEWVSRTEDGYTANACWDCLLDAYFELDD